MSTLVATGCAASAAAFWRRSAMSWSCGYCQDTEASLGARPSHCGQGRSCQPQGAETYLTHATFGSVGGRRATTQELESATLRAILRPSPADLPRTRLARAGRQF